MSQIVVTGIGVVSAAGWTPDEVWAALMAGRSGLGPLTLFPSPRCGRVPVAEVRGDLAARSGMPDGSRTDQLALWAAREAFRDAALEAQARDAIGIVLGNCTGGIGDSERFVYKLLRENRADFDLLRRHECACAANAAAEALGLGGFRATVSEACASGAMAVVTACDAIRGGEAEVVLAGGVDSLTRLTLNGFCSLLNVSPDGCRPFDAGRNGMNLGEGAGVLVLETAGHAAARGARPLAAIAGCGATCDAYHSTAPSPDGEGGRRAMALALEAARLRPQDVDYLNAHGTGTIENDAAEARAISALFGDRVPRVSSTKRFFGHTLAAAGAIEAILCVLSIQRQAVPANLGLQRLDPAFRFAPIAQAEPARVRVTMSNSLGFGGQNCSLVITAPDSSGRQP